MFVEYLCNKQRENLDETCAAANPAFALIRASCFPRIKNIYQSRARSLQRSQSGRRSSVITFSEIFNSDNRTQRGMNRCFPTLRLLFRRYGRAIPVERKIPANIIILFFLFYPKKISLFLRDAVSSARTFRPVAFISAH
jgi:hypothetical protein